MAAADPSGSRGQAGQLEGRLLWSPSQARLEQANLTRYLTWLAAQRGLRFRDYAELHAWSVAELEAFWQSIVDYFAVKLHAPYERVLSSRTMPFSRWFEGATLNFAEHCLAGGTSGPAVLALKEGGAREELSWAELGSAVARARTGLRRLGVKKGDRVAAVLPNGVEAVVGFLATASLGAIWSSAAPEFGVSSVLDRFAQISPKVLLASTGYRYAGKDFDRREAVTQLREGLPSLAHTVLVPGAFGAAALPGCVSYGELLAEEGQLEFEAVPFEHPLWVLYSSGTTGLPKPIVHGHGGVLLELLKALSLHCDLGPTDRFFWFSTTGWMMWNFLVGGLLVGSTIVLYDGSPGHPDLMQLWRIAEQEKLTYLGTSAAYLQACQKAGLSPGRVLDLSSLRSLGTTGSPLPAEGFVWVYEHLGAGAPADLLLASVSGGTDVCTAFVLSCPLLPVHAGEIQARGLGADVHAFDDAGHDLEGEVGELVLTAPLPSMPVCFWGDADGSRLRESYFSAYEGVWRHGDWVKFNERGGSVIYGRSDSTLNRGGVRMGTSEFYRVVESLPEVVDSLVLDTSHVGGSEGQLLLFVVLPDGVALEPQLEAKLRQLIRRELSPRHVPDRILAIGEVPRTLSGKKLEVPVKKILLGAEPERVASPDTLKNPEALRPFCELAKNFGG